MKIFILTLSFLSLAFLAESQTTWYVINETLSPYLTHYYETCWPNGTIVVSSSDSSTTLTANQWAGPGCDSYGLFTGQQFTIDNGADYGYINNNHSVRFNYEYSGSSSMTINLWFGCEGTNPACDITGSVFLTSSNPYPSCEFYVGSTLYNLCSDIPSFNASVPYLGNLSVSIGKPNVPNCAGNQNTWARINRETGECIDAIASPTYTSGSQGLEITYPIDQSQTSGINYQIQFLVSCSLTSGSPSLPILSVNESNVNVSLFGGFPFGCGVTSGCTPTTVGSASYNLCELTSRVYNVSLILGGQISFTLGQNSVLFCPNQSSGVAISESASGNCDVIATEMEWSQLSGSGEGLQVAFTGGESYIQPIVNLICNANQDPSKIIFTNVSFDVGDGSEPSFSITGITPYACALKSTTLIV